MRRFKLIARAGGTGSSLIDVDTGLAIDGVVGVTVQAQVHRATRLIIDFIGEVEAEIEVEGEHVEMRQAAPTVSGNGA